MYMQVPVEVREIKQKLEQIMTTSLDMFFEKKTSLRSLDQQGKQQVLFYFF